MSDTFLSQLDRCRSALEARQQQQRAAEIRTYARRLERRLDRVIELIADVRVTQPEALLVPLERWAERVCDQIDEHAIATCDPRLDQSLTDLVTMLVDTRNLIVAMPVNHRPEGG